MSVELGMVCNGDGVGGGICRVGDWVWERRVGWEGGGGNRRVHWFLPCMKMSALPVKSNANIR